MISKRLFKTLTVCLSLFPLTALAYHGEQQFENGAQHWFANAGVYGAYLQHPGTQLPFSYVPVAFAGGTGTSRNLDKKQVWSVMPTLTFGYKFDNTFWPSVFGDRADIQLGAEYSTRRTTVAETGALGNVFIWRIDGTGLLNNIGTGQTGGYDLTGLDYDFRYTYQHYNLYFVGHRKFFNSNFTSNPSFGLDYFQISQANNMDYNYRNTNTSGILYGAHTDDNAISHFYGIHFGENINYQIANPVAVFVDANLSLLHVQSTLTAHQRSADGEIASGVITLYTSNTTSKALTYMVQASTGFNFNLYHFQNSPNTITANVSASIERWAYNPRIVNPTSASGKKAHVEGVNGYNAFFGAQIHVPFD